MRYIFLIIASCLCIQLYSQDKYKSKDKEKDKEENPYILKGLQYGFNFGAYFPSNKTANYYDGEQSHTLSLYNAIMDSVYKKGDLYFINYNHQNIRESVFNGDDFIIKQYPDKIKYSVTTNVGFHVKENLNDNWGIYLEFNYSKLRAEGRFYLERLNGLGVQPLYPYNIIANESRVDINLGVCKSFGSPKPFKPFIEGALNFSNTKVISADAEIGGHSYSYLDPYDVQYGIRDYGIGYGALLGGGIQIIATQAIILHTGIDFSLKRIHLGDNKNTNLNTILYIRVLFHQLISTKSDS